MRTKKGRSLLRCVPISYLLYGFEQSVLDAPELGRVIDVVGLGILEAANLLPEGLDLVVAILANLFDRRAFINALALVKELHLQGLDHVIGDDLLLPGVDGMEQHVGLLLVDDLIAQREHIAQRLAGQLIKEAVSLLKVRGGNPYYIEDLRHKTGDDKEVRDYVMNSKISEEFYAKLTDMIQFLVPQYIEEGKQHLVIGIGCTGGRHRSVTISNLIYDDLVNRGYRVVKKHRDSMLR